MADDIPVPTAEHGQGQEILIQGHSTHFPIQFDEIGKFLDAWNGSNMLSIDVEDDFHQRLQR